MGNVAKLPPKWQGTKKLTVRNSRRRKTAGVLFGSDIYSGVEGSGRPDEEDTPGFEPGEEQDAEQTPGFTPTEGHDIEETPGFTPTEGHEVEETPDNARSARRGRRTA